MRHRDVNSRRSKSTGKDAPLRRTSLGFGKNTVSARLCLRCNAMHNREMCVCASTDTSVAYTAQQANPINTQSWRGRGTQDRKNRNNERVCLRNQQRTGRAHPPQHVAEGLRRRPRRVGLSNQMLPQTMLNEKREREQASDREREREPGGAAGAAWPRGRAAPRACTRSPRRAQPQRRRRRRRSRRYRPRERAGARLQCAHVKGRNTLTLRMCTSTWMAHTHTHLFCTH